MLHFSPRGSFRGSFRLNCPAQLNVQAFHGSEGGDARAEEGVNVAVCTMEKANSIVNRLAEEGRLEVRFDLQYFNPKSLINGSVLI